MRSLPTNEDGILHVLQAPDGTLPPILTYALLARTSRRQSRDLLEARCHRRTGASLDQLESRDSEVDLLSFKTDELHNRDRDLAVEPRRGKSTGPGQSFWEGSRGGGIRAGPRSLGRHPAVQRRARSTAWI